jgi:hypothetical protein
MFSVPTMAAPCTNPVKFQKLNRVYLKKQHSHFKIKETRYNLASTELLVSS